jgi:hypothetical protein
VSSEDTLKKGGGARLLNETISSLFPVCFLGCHLFSTTSVALFLALFFQPSSVFNNFSALFFGLFRFVFGARSCVINNFSALFFKKGILLFFFKVLIPS